MHAWRSRGAVAAARDALEAERSPLASAGPAAARGAPEVRMMVPAELPDAPSVYAEL